MDYITKPFEKAEVMARIRLHLKLKLAHRAVIEEQAARLRQIAEAQQSILVQPDDYPEARFAIKYVPILEAGGDFYDVFPAGSKTFCYFVADICGHDLGASFVTSSLKALVRQKFRAAVHSHRNDEEHQFGAQDHIEGRQVSYRPGVLPAQGEFPLTVNQRRPPSGNFMSIAMAKPVSYREKATFWAPSIRCCLEPVTMRVEQGDRLYLFTDGLTERFGTSKVNRTQGRKPVVAAFVRSIIICRSRRRLKPLWTSSCPHNPHRKTTLCCWGWRYEPF